ncbi:MAG TPA: lysophospholipid acyltransferase family protein, partial [Geobacteraceae bacterium]|nr:lysophospholipid acyltransferase family protein [Geobacteraceae bacterium]
MKKNFLRRLWVTFSANVIGLYASTINRFLVKGDENIPCEGGVLLACNHISAYDTVFIPWAVVKRHPLQMIWAPAKEELFRKRFQGWLYSSWGAFPVKRGRDVRAGKVISDLLRDQKVMLFPEGTRNRDGVLGKGNRGVGKLIFDSRPTVIPTALVGLNRWKFPGAGQQAAVVFGNPLDLSDLFDREDCKETHVLIVERVMGEIASLLCNEGAL